jgi:hypothetical protein
MSVAINRARNDVSRKIEICSVMSTAQNQRNSRLGIAEVAGERDDGDAGEAQTKNDPERILDKERPLLLIIKIRDRLLGALC